MAEPAHAPFGEPYNETGTQDRSFTGKDEDTVTGLYNFPARLYCPVQGRWLSPDPSRLAAVDLSNPQTLNAYAYVSNGPLAAVDEKGLNAAAWGMDNGCVWSWRMGSEGDIHPPFMDIACGGGGFGGDPSGGGGHGGETLQQRFTRCNDNFGDQNSWDNLTYDKYAEAASAAGKADVSTAEILALWSKENTFNTDMQWNSSDVIGPMKIGNPAVKDVQGSGVTVPNDWDETWQANLVAGGQYYKFLDDKYGSTGNSIYGYYTGGGTPSNWSDRVKNEITIFNGHLDAYRGLVKCMDH